MDHRVSIQEAPGSGVPVADPDQFPAIDADSRQLQHDDFAGCMSSRCPTAGGGCLSGFPGRVCSVSRIVPSPAQNQQSSQVRDVLPMLQRPPQEPQ